MERLIHLVVFSALDGNTVFISGIAPRLVGALLWVAFHLRLLKWRRNL